MASVLTSEQVTYLKSGEVFILHGCTGTLSKRYFAITNTIRTKRVGLQQMNFHLQDALVLYIIWNELA